MAQDVESCLAHSAFDSPLFSSHLVSDVGSANSLYTASRSIRLLVELGDLDVIGHDGTVLDSRQSKRDVHSGIVVLTCSHQPCPCSP
jgi:hypothetical protein